MKLNVNWVEVVRIKIKELKFFVYFFLFYFEKWFKILIWENCMFFVKICKKLRINFWLKDGCMIIFVLSVCIINKNE